MVSQIQRQLSVRAARIQSPPLRGATFGSLAQLAPDETAERVLRPRHAYGFTGDVCGARWLGAGLGPFFIWVTKDEPLAANNVALHNDVGEPPGLIPAKYVANIRGWGAAYAVTPLVLNGAACLAAVRITCSIVLHACFIAIDAGEGGVGAPGAGWLSPG
jgi:hypothetical protein